MKILSVDTSSKNCSVSLTEANDNSFDVINFKNDDDERTHSQKLMPMIDMTFKETNYSLDDVNLLACCVGPGSFTGIRIGVASVKAFADSRNIPVVGVTSLEGLGYNVENNGYVIPLIDAKHDNVYSVLFSHNNNEYNVDVENSTENIESVLNTYKDYILSHGKNDIYVVGDGSIIYKDIILKVFEGLNVIFSSDNEQSSISLAKCAYNKYQHGIYGDSNCISPIYLRKSQAERFANGEK